jgi:ribosome-binding factor A
VFYTVLGDDAERAGTAAALDSATGMLRTAVGQQLGIKFAPTLAFVLDATPESAKQIEDLLAQVQAADAAAAASAVGKEFAGEADPYRKPREAEEDDEQ